MTRTVIDNCEISSLCEEYKKTGSVLVRNRIIDLHLGYIKHIAKRVRRRLQFRVETNDLISDGVLGFIEALNTFDLSMGVKLTTHCTKRVKGEMITQACKRHYWATLAFRNHERNCAKAETRLRTEHGKVLTAEEVAECLKIPVKKAQNVVNGAQIVRSHPQILIDSEEGFALRNFVDCKTPSPAYQLFFHANFCDLLVGLKKREKLLCILSFLDEKEMSQREIAESIGVSQSAVCLATNAVLKIIKKRLVDCHFYRPDGKKIRDVGVSC